MTEQTASTAQAQAQATADPVISPDANLELVNILRSKSATAIGTWELGYRLWRSRVSKQFLETDVNGRRPTDWSDFVCDFVDISVATAERAMDIGWFTRKQVLRWGTERLCALKRIANITSVDETPEQAIALELPVADGGTKPFTEMGIEEVEEALRMMREEDRRVKRPSKAEQAAAPEAAPEPAVSAGQIEAGGQQVAEAMAQLSRMNEQIAGEAQSLMAQMAEIQKTPIAETMEKMPLPEPVKIHPNAVKALKASASDLLAPFVKDEGIEVYQHGGETYLDVHRMPFNALGPIGEMLKQVSRWRPRS